MNGRTTMLRKEVKRIVKKEKRFTLNAYERKIDQEPHQDLHTLGLTMVFTLSILLPQKFSIRASLMMCRHQGISSLAHGAIYCMEASR